MERETQPRWKNFVPLEVAEILNGKLVYNSAECPGVCHIAIHGEGDTSLAREYYIVETDTPVISKAAKAYGNTVPGYSRLLLYPHQDLYSGYKIIEYEIAKYLVGNGYTLPDGDTLREIELFNMEYHPEYFGEYPVPNVTPKGLTIRHSRLVNGAYWVETDQAEHFLTICYPIWRTEFSRYTLRISQQTKFERTYNIEDTKGDLFFAMKDSCVPILEMLETRRELEQDARLNLAALMNAIWTYHPLYAISKNAQSLDKPAEDIIVLTPGAGTKFLCL